MIVMGRSPFSIVRHILISVRQTRCQVMVIRLSLAVQGALTESKSRQWCHPGHEDLVPPYGVTEAGRVAVFALAGSSMATQLGIS